MTCQKSHHLPFDYSLFPPVLTLITAALIPVCFVVLLAVSFRASPWRGGCRERSQRSCLRPGGLPSLTRNPRLAATVPVAPPTVAPWPALRHPGKRPPGCKGQRRFANRASRGCGGCLPLLCPVPFTCLSPCRRGQRQPQPLRQSRGEMHIPQNFLPKSRQKVLRSARTVVSGRGSDAPCGEGSQKGDGEYRREQKAGPRKTLKPRLPKLKR